LRRNGHGQRACSFEVKILSESSHHGSAGVAWQPAAEGRGEGDNGLPMDGAGGLLMMMASTAKVKVAFFPAQQQERAAFWSLEKLSNRIYLMRDLYARAQVCENHSLIVNLGEASVLGRSLWWRGEAGRNASAHRALFSALVVVNRLGCVSVGNVR
jgi:hypothetical protein